MVASSVGESGKCANGDEACPTHGPSVTRSSSLLMLRRHDRGSEEGVRAADLQAGELKRIYKGRPFDRTARGWGLFVPARGELLYIRHRSELALVE